MLSIYAYTTESNLAADLASSRIRVKIGMTEGSVSKRLKQQSTALSEPLRLLNVWSGFSRIKADIDVHNHPLLSVHQIIKETGDSIQGSEWFKIPVDINANPVEAQAVSLIDTVIADLEGKRIRPTLVLHSAQERALDQAISIISSTPSNSTDIIANLCPRFGKTLWALSLFNYLAENYGVNTLVVPAYVLGSHTSFESDCRKFNGFQDIQLVRTEEEYEQASLAGRRSLVLVSLHGDFDSWVEKNEWLINIDSSKKFIFADEGDFGTHTDRQTEKLELVLGLVNVYASGTNVQRLSKCTDKVDGVIYTAYSQLEAEVSGTLKRRFYASKINGLANELAELKPEVLPSWIKIWGRPYQNKAFIHTFFQSLAGEDPLHPELNLSSITGEQISCAMLLLNANNQEMLQIEKIASTAIPSWTIFVLNGEVTDGRSATLDVKRALVKSKAEGKDGLIIIANQMGARSFSIPEIQASIIAFDRGSVDSVAQKTSRCLTPGVESRKYGHIIDFSLDSNRSENIEKLILEEAVSLIRAGVAVDFQAAIRYILSCINLFRVNEYGYTEEVTEADLFKIFDENLNLLRIADVSVSMDKIDEEMLELLNEVELKKVVGGKAPSSTPAVKNRITISAPPRASGEKKSQETKLLEQKINDVIRAVNRSATSIYNLAGADSGATTYRECLWHVIGESYRMEELWDIFGFSVTTVWALLEKQIVNEAILDVIVANSSRGVGRPYLVTDVSKGILGEPDSEELWKEIIAQIPSEVLLRKGVRVLSVACGHGTEARLIAERMRSLGVAEEDVLESIWCLDKYSVFTNEVQRKYGFKNIIHADFLEWSTGMKFDVVVGNPPYQETTGGKRKDQASNLWSKFWFRSIELTNANGIIALITPTSWCSPSKDDSTHGRLWDVFEQNSAIANISTVKDYFPGVGSTFGYVILNKGKSGGLSFIGLEKLSVDFMPKSGYDVVSENLHMTRNLGSVFNGKQGMFNNSIQVSIPMTRILKEENIEILEPNEVPKSGSMESNLYFYYQAPDKEAATYIRNRIISCLDILNTHCRWSGFLNLRVIKLIKA